VSYTVETLYLVASVLFVMGIRGLTRPETARRGVLYAELGMACAVAGTLAHDDITSYRWIVVAGGVGAAIGIAMAALIPMTKMPERIALSHAFGGLAAALVGVCEYYLHAAELSRVTMGAIGFEVLFGSLTFTGSLMAFGKLQGLVSPRNITYPMQNVSNVGAFVALVALLVVLTIDPGQAGLFYVLFFTALALGVLIVIPIGAADMPVVIALLNSYAGLAAAATGFVLDNRVLIIAGALDGASGFVLSVAMSRAMNRSFANVLFGAFGQVAESGLQAEARAAHVREASIGDATLLLSSAPSVIIVPGYGMAVAQAQHAVRELGDHLESNGARVRYAIHPVAGRMPGHMNVLLAEADVPYDHLFELDAINDDFADTDVCLVVGANDVVNPAAKEDESSPIYGMPVLNADQARTCIVLKRTLSPGFAGIENDLFARENTVVVFGDAKETLSRMIEALA